MELAEKWSPYFDELDKIRKDEGLSSLSELHKEAVGSALEMAAKRLTEYRRELIMEDDTLQVSGSVLPIAAVAAMQAIDIAIKKRSC